MAGKNDFAVAIVVTGLTNSQATNMLAATMNTKAKIAPNSRGTAVKGTQQTIGKIMQAKNLSITTQQGR